MGKEADLLKELAVEYVLPPTSTTVHLVRSNDSDLNGVSTMIDWPEGMQLTATPEQIGDVLSAFAVSKNNDVQRAISKIRPHQSPKENPRQCGGTPTNVCARNELTFNNGSHAKKRKALSFGGSTCDYFRPARYLFLRHIVEEGLDVLTEDEQQELLVIERDTFPAEVLVRLRQMVRQQLEEAQDIAPPTQAEEDESWFTYILAHLRTRSRSAGWPHAERENLARNAPHRLRNE